ncbi:MAG: M48 family metalloprotease [Asgard group archaeon]|nr:M48 family metalloprotease [Asgard group archaeon]
MTIPKELFLTRAKLHTSGIFYYLLNIFHIVLVSTSKIEPKSTGLLRYQFNFFSQFNLTTFLIAFSILFLQFLISYIMIFIKFRSSNFVQLTEKGITGRKNNHSLSNLRIKPKKLYRWIEELAEEQNIKSIKRIYLTNTRIPNALTLDILPLPFIRRTWVVLDANILEILEEREIKAVISHELGHVKRLDGLINLSRISLNYFVFLTYSLFIVEMVYYLIVASDFSFLTIFLRIAFLLIILFILYILTLLNRILLRFFKRNSELLADYYAAKKIGRNHVINALIIMGQRRDVLSAFAKEFQWLGKREGKNEVTKEFRRGLHSLSPNEMSKQITRENALSIYVSNKLKHLRETLEVPLTNKQITELTEEASQKLYQIRKNDLNLNNGENNHFIEGELLELTLDWINLDENRDYYLTEKEITELVSKLRENPEKELFDEDVHRQTVLFFSEHPTMKDRILFLYETLPSTS